jgi:hypothetical protein
MNDRQDIDYILKQWPFDPTAVNVRRVHLPERTVLQMRLDMGLLQLEISLRPDGKRPHGAPTYCDYLKAQFKKLGDKFAISDNDRNEIDREFVQYYHRRVCWLHLHEFARAVEDADHTLELMDFCQDKSEDQEWVISHEQYRPFVLYHRTQAAALALIEADGEDVGERAIDAVNEGLSRIRVLFEQYDAIEQFESDELVVQLSQFQESLRDRYKVVRTLEEKLSDAITAEDYELAAKLRDELGKRNGIAEAE